MSDSTPTGRSKVKAPSPDEDRLVELRPPAESGFGGTAKFRAKTDAVLIRELIRRGYSEVAIEPDTRQGDHAA